jgi:hypothetical protein
MGFKAVVRVVLPTIALTEDEALSLAESLLFHIMRKDTGRPTSAQNVQPIGAVREVQVKPSRGRPAKRWMITDPSGQVFEVRNLERFCLDRGLNSSNVVYYKNGYKGWSARCLTAEHHPATGRR